MIEFTCDRCDKTLSVPDEKAGTKIDCPHCGDVNRVPEASSHADGGAQQSPAQRDRAAAKGLPPDSGPEVRVMVARPSLGRSRPFTTFFLAFVPAAAAIVIAILVSRSGGDWQRFWYLFAGAPLLGWLILAGWGSYKAYSEALVITNKRTVHRTGLLSRRTSEVMHDHVRNVEINQSFIDRVFNVGRVGLSSSGQEGIEIEIIDLPRPAALKEVIDLYRPL